MSETKIKAEHLKFCRAYAKNGGNGTQAALSAGYSKKNARNISSLLLQKPYIIKKIAQLHKPVEEMIADEFKYTARECFLNLQKIQKLALENERFYPEKNVFIKKPDLQAALKAEELKARLANLFKDNDDGNKAKDINIIIKNSKELNSTPESE